MNAGLLWGAYHFLRPISIPAQVDFFLKIAAPDNATLLALDHEDERVPLINAQEFLLRVEHTVGRRAVLYSGYLIKEQLDGPQCCARLQSALPSCPRYCGRLDLFD